MSIEIKGKVYRNLQEQVEKNKEDIEVLDQKIPEGKSLFIVKLNYRNEPLEASNDHFYGTLTFLVNADQVNDYSNLTFNNLLNATGYVEVEGVQEPMGVFDFDKVLENNNHIQLIGLGSNWVLSIGAYTNDYITPVKIV